VSGLPQARAFALTIHLNVDRRVGAALALACDIIARDFKLEFF
jgi:hypothetical protein